MNSVFKMPEATPVYAKQRETIYRDFGEPLVDRGRVRRPCGMRPDDHDLKRYWNLIQNGEDAR